MNKTDLTRNLATSANLTLAQAKSAIDALFGNTDSYGIIANAVATDGSVVLQGFGSFKRKERAARKGVNPSTGEAIDIAASTGVHFKAGKDLADRLAKG